MLVAVAAEPLRGAWAVPVSFDLDTYAAAGAVARRGGDPYDPVALRAVTPDARAFVYPRATLPVLAPLADVPRGPRARAWAVAQLAALALALGAAVATSPRPWRTAAAGAAATLLLGGAVRSAVGQGNVEPLVAGALGLGLVAAGRGRGGLAGALIGVGAAFKLWPAVWLAAPGAREGRARKVVVGLVALAGVVAVELASTAPFAWWREVRRMDARGPLDPSLRALLADLADARWLPRVGTTWPLAAGAAALVTAGVLRRARPGPARDALVALAVLTVLPRVQDYGLLQALVPLALAASTPAPWAGLAAGAVGLALGWRYAAWAVGAVTWAVLVATLGRGPSASGAADRGAPTR